MSAKDPQQKPLEGWDSADAYERYVGRWSRIVAREFIPWLHVSAGSRWLDVGCGAGALSRAVLDLTEPDAVVGVDSSERYVEHTRSAITDPRARFVVGDARALPVEDEAVDAVVSGLMLNFVPEADRPGAVAEMRRVLRPGGVVGAYLWDYAGEMQFMRWFWDVAVELDPDALEKDEGRRFAFCQPDPLAALFRGAGLADVEVQGITVPTVFRDFDDYWQPFLGGQGTAPGYTMSLGEEHRAALREQLRARLPVASDGSIPLSARVWAVRGYRAPE